MSGIVYTFKLVFNSTIIVHKSFNDLTLKQSDRLQAPQWELLFQASLPSLHVRCTIARSTHQLLSYWVHSSRSERISANDYEKTVMHTKKLAYYVK